MMIFMHKQQVLCVLALFLLIEWIKQSLTIEDEDGLVRFILSLKVVLQRRVERIHKPLRPSFFSHAKNHDH